MLLRMSSTTQQPPLPQDFTFAKDPDFYESYANSIQVQTCLFDFALIFGMLQQLSPTKVQVNQMQAVFISPQQAKALLGVLTENLRKYEEAFGQINLELKGGPLLAVTSERPQ